MTSIPYKNKCEKVAINLDCNDPYLKCNITSPSEGSPLSNKCEKRERDKLPWCSHLFNRMVTDSGVTRNTAIKCRV